MVALTPASGRVLGCLIEKQLATPQQYPLTLNGLSSACNQATNRHPVMALTDEVVLEALNELKLHHLVRFVLPSHGKSVTRYRHVLGEIYGLETDQVALLAVLLLRGPQTPGELRARSGRMATFTSVPAVQDQLDVLAGRTDALVLLLPRQPGQKEDRWQQLLAEESTGTPATGVSPSPPAFEPSRSSRASPPSPGNEDHRDADPADTAESNIALESRVDELVSEMADIREQVADLRSSLDTLLHTLGE